ncbi:hypothetical protein LEP1GSC158_5291 [Leptospira interrogans serovar Zanoni str. LT2156]|uniref:Uncharacterized protein n=1 Tax=Leptospira interrogans serovar Zanoni str. LT2156 TaxID=1001601 RepID=M6HQ77_LEPIR|nr:hypothetical protein LEP1GSC158_5291 [Leptospira interrogans serovar Zanoni str. LT2156]
MANLWDTIVPTNCTPIFEFMIIFVKDSKLLTFGTNLQFVVKPL